MKYICIYPKNTSPECWDCDCGLWGAQMNSSFLKPKCYEPVEWGVSAEISRFIPLQVDGAIKRATYYVSAHLHNKEIATFPIFFCHHLKNCNLLCTSGLADHPLLHLFPRLHSIWLHSPHCMNKKKKKKMDFQPCKHREPRFYPQRMAVCRINIKYSYADLHFRHIFIYFFLSSYFLTRPHCVGSLI